MGDPFVSAAARGLAALNPPTRLLIAISGGGDSTALLDALWRGRERSDLRHFELVAGHFDHGLRDDSHVDRASAEELAREREIPFVARAEPVRPPRGVSLEQEARDRRYEALAAMASEANCGAVVTAHTATDQAETFLWRLVRGAGMRGLGAMRPDRPLGGLRLLRPLLGVTREETREHCARHQLRFRDDPTNENDRPRARIRAAVLPTLEAIQPGATLRIAAATARMREDDDALEEMSQPTRRTAELRALPPALRRRALVRWVESQLGTRLRLTAAHVAALEALVDHGRGQVELPADAMTHRVASVLDGVLLLTTQTRVGG